MHFLYVILDTTSSACADATIRIQRRFSHFLLHTTCHTEWDLDNIESYLDVAHATSWQHCMIYFMKNHGVTTWAACEELCRLSWGTIYAPRAPVGCRGASKTCTTVIQESQLGEQPCEMQVPAGTLMVDHGGDAWIEPRKKSEIGKKTYRPRAWTTTNAREIECKISLSVIFQNVVHGGSCTIMSMHETSSWFCMSHHRSPWTAMRL